MKPCCTLTGPWITLSHTQHTKPDSCTFGFMHETAFLRLVMDMTVDPRPSVLAPYPAGGRKASSRGLLTWNLSEVSQWRWNEMVLCSTTIAAVSSNACHHTAMSLGLQHWHRFKVAPVALLLSQLKYNIAWKALDPRVLECGVPICGEQLICNSKQFISSCFTTPNRNETAINWRHWRPTACELQVTLVTPKVATCPFWDWTSRPIPMSQWQQPPTHLDFRWSSWLHSNSGLTTWEVWLLTFASLLFLPVYLWSILLYFGLSIGISALACAASYTYKLPPQGQPTADLTGLCWHTLSSLLRTAVWCVFYDYCGSYLKYVSIQCCYCGFLCVYLLATSIKQRVQRWW